MRYYPAFLDLTGKKVLVVGGGQVAQRKIETLVECGALVSIVARDLTPVLKEYVDQERIRFSGAEFEDAFLEGAVLAIAATDDQQSNKEVSVAAKERAIFVNTVDQPSDCTFIVPSILKRGDLVVAVSTSGKSPSVAKQLRERLEEVFGPEWESYLSLLGKVREEILSRSEPSGERAKIFRGLIDSDLLVWIRIADWGRAASILNSVLGTDYSAGDVEALAGGGLKQK